MVSKTRPTRVVKSPTDATLSHTLDRSAPGALQRRRTMSLSHRHALISSLVLAISACAAQSEQVDQDQAEQRGRRGGGGGVSASFAGDGSFAQCVSRQSGFGSIGYHHSLGCTETLNIIMCDQNNHINPTVSCTSPTVGALEPQQGVSFTRGHCTEPCGAADTVRDFFGSCFAPKIPVPTNGDLSTGYTCEEPPAVP